jgi:hypothetical protein
MANARDEFVPLYDEYNDSGLEIVYTLYADSTDRPLFEDPDLEEAHKNFVSSYHDSIESGWPVLADIGWQMQPFFDGNGPPVGLLISTDDMVIQHLSLGHEPKALEASIKEMLER